MGTVREALAATEQQLADAEGQLAWAQGRYNECRMIHEGLKLAVAKFDLALDEEVDPVPVDTATIPNRREG